MRYSASLTDDGERSPTDHGTGDDHDADVVPLDQAGGHEAEESTDHEEDGDCERDRPDRPVALLAERVEVDRQAVEGEPGVDEQHHEATGDHPPAGERAQRS